MGLTLPGELERLLNDLGFTWPEVDEQDLFSVGGEWCSFGSAVSNAHSTSTGASQQLLSRNRATPCRASRPAAAPQFAAHGARRRRAPA